MTIATVSLSELRTVLSRAIDSVAEALGDDVTIGSSTYWKIESTDSFDMSSTPNVNVGSLADDIEHIRALRDAPLNESSISPWHDLDHLIGVLSRLSMMTRA
jgi:hypothetical protein